MSESVCERDFLWKGEGVPGWQLFLGAICWNLEKGNFGGHLDFWVHLEFGKYLGPFGKASGSILSWEFWISEQVHSEFGRDHLEFGCFFFSLPLTTASFSLHLTSTSEYLNLKTYS